MSFSYGSEILPQKGFINCGKDPFIKSFKPFWEWNATVLGITSGLGGWYKRIIFGAKLYILILLVVFPLHLEIWPDDACRKFTEWVLKISQLNLRTGYIKITLAKCCVLTQGSSFVLFLYFREVTWLKGLLCSNSLYIIVKWCSRMFEDGIIW